MRENLSIQKMEKGLIIILENNRALCGELMRLLRAQGHADAHVRVEAWVRCMICKAHEPALAMSLPLALDEVWHLALLQTREYAALCADIGGIFVHHSTTTEQDTEEQKNARLETLRRVYFTIFGAAAPVDGFWKDYVTKKRNRESKLYHLLKIKQLDGKVNYLRNVNSSTTIEDFKTMITQVTGLISYFQIVYNGKVLNDTQTLEEYDVKNGSIIHIVPNGRGC